MARRLCACALEDGSTADCIPAELLDNREIVLPYHAAADIPILTGATQQSRSPP